MNALDLGPVPFAAHARENRESYTEQQVSAAVAAASGTTASAKIATIETCARLWEFAFSTGVSKALPPWALGRIGRELVLRGHSVWWKSTASGLLPVSDVDVRGVSASPDRWRYRITLPSPGSSITRTVTADQVLHVRIGAPTARPWAGSSPLAQSQATVDVLKEIDRSWKEEHAGPVGHLVPVPSPASSQDVANGIAVLRGRTLLTEASEMDLAGEGASSRNPWKPQRVGPEPTQGSALARDAVERSILAAGGIPPGLVFGGTDFRASWGAFLAGTVAPSAGLVSAELSRLGLDSVISFRGLNQSDLQARSRSYKQLRDGGMDDAKAASICGFDM